MKTVLTTTAVVLAVLTPGAVSAAPQTSEPVAVKYVMSGGGGCPAGTVTAETTADGSTTKATFTGFRVLSNGAASERARDCLVGLDVTKPEGWTYALRRVTVDGIADVAQGGKATARLETFHQGGTSSGAATRVIDGGHAGPWQVDDALETSPFAPCGSKRQLNVRIALSADGSPDNVAVTAAVGSLTVSSADLELKRCDS